MAQILEKETSLEKKKAYVVCIPPKKKLKRKKGQGNKREREKKRVREPPLWTLVGGLSKWQQAAHVTPIILKLKSPRHLETKKKKWSN